MCMPSDWKDPSKIKRDECEQQSRRPHILVAFLIRRKTMWCLPEWRKKNSKTVNGIRFLTSTVIISGGQKAKNMTFKFLRRPNRYFSEKQISSVYHPEALSWKDYSNIYRRKNFCVMWNREKHWVQKKVMDKEF